MSEPLAWTKARPTKPGFYFIRPMSCKKIDPSKKKAEGKAYFVEAKNEY